MIAVIAFGPRVTALDLKPKLLVTLDVVFEWSVVLCGVGTIKKSMSHPAGSSPASARCFDFAHRSIDHPVQMGSGILDVEVFVLSGAAFRGKHRAPMHILEIAIGKLVSLLRILALLIVDSQMPFTVFMEAV
ncbi:MAG: hypothetical protein ACRD3Q_00760 [Terriglobales bacterium]